MRVKLLKVPHRIKGESLGRIVAVIGQFGLDHDPRLVGGLEILRQFAMRVQAHVVESGGPRDLEMPEVLLFRGWRDQRGRINKIIAEPAHEKRLVVQEETVAANLDLTHTEAFCPAVYRRLAVTQLDLRHIKVRLFRRPRMEGVKFHPATDFRARFTFNKRDRLLADYRWPMADCRLNLHAQQRILQPARLCRSRDGRMHLGSLLVEIAAYPGVVNARVGRSLDFHVAIEPAEPVRQTKQSLATRQHVVDRRDHHRLCAGVDEIRDVVLIGAAIVVHPGDRRVVDPKPTLRTYAADFEPDPLPLPCRRDVDRLTVPPLTFEKVAQRFRAMVPLAVPRVAHARLAHALSLPAPRHLNQSCILPRFFEKLIPTWMTPRTKISDLRDELPLAAQRHLLLQW